MSNCTETARMRRRRFIQFGAAAVSAVSRAKVPGLRTGKKKSGKRPNIVYVFSDEHRRQSLPFTEEPHISAPNMKLLAEQGTQFSNCCSTSPICVPYRAMLMTGQWPHQNGYVSNHWYGDGQSIGISSPTLAHAFRMGGYRTGYVGKWHLMNETCGQAGFDYFKHWLYGDDHWKTEVRDIPGAGEFETVKGYNAVGMTDQAIEFMEADDDRPFFLMLSLNPPHWRWDDAPAEYMALYPDGEMVFRPNVANRYKKGKERFYFRNYQAHISGVDAQLGRIMDCLRAGGLEENTVLIYTSDHGSSFGSNGVSSKANPYEESVRIPFIARWPGRIPEGKVADHNVGTVDMFPTLCGLAGIRFPETCEGTDFSPALLGKPCADPDTQFIAVNSFPRNYFRNQLQEEHSVKFCPFRGVRSRRYSYAVNAAGEWLLYDNRADPFQMKNLVDDPACADIKARLQEELELWLARAEDPFIPDEWKALPLPERIALQNQHYTLRIYEAEWRKYREAAAASVAAPPELEDELRAAADLVFDGDFFGRYKALGNELSGRRRESDLPLESVRRQLSEHEAAAKTEFMKRAEQILQLRKYS